MPKVEDLALVDLMVVGSWEVARIAIAALLVVAVAFDLAKQVLVVPCSQVVEVLLVLVLVSNDQLDSITNLMSLHSSITEQEVESVLG